MMEQRVINHHSNLTSKLSKPHPTPTNKLNNYPQFYKQLQSTKDKIEQKPFLHRRRASEFKGSSPMSLLDGFSKKILEVKPREKVKPNNCQGTSFQKVAKENQNKEGPVVIRSRLRVPTRSCQPSPAKNISRDELIPVSIERKPIVESGHRKNQSVSIISNSSKILKEQPSANDPKKDKKRVKIFRIDRFAKVQEQQIMPPEEMYANQLFINNPAIEQELLKEYLGIDKQTFGFEKQMLCGSCNISEENSEPHANIPKTTSEAIIPSKSSMNKAENKQKTVTTKDSSNSFAGMTTNSTCRYKGAVGLTSGYSERENLDLIELIQWSSETERNANSQIIKKAFAEAQVHVQKAAVEPKPVQKKPVKKQPSKAVTPVALKNELSRLTKEKFKVNRNGYNGLKIRDPSV